MGVPTSEVGYTSAMPRREDHEVHKGHVVALGGGELCLTDEEHNTEYTAFKWKKILPHSTRVYNGYRVFPGGKVEPGSAADHSPPSSAAVVEE